MRYFQKMNLLAGWVVFAVAMLVYWLTLEPTASFWDCGEFIACSYKLQVPHPPGAPFFLLFNRLFSFLAAGDVYKVAYFINLSSALASAFTIAFLFWSISLMALKFLPRERRQNPSAYDTWLIVLASTIGSLAYAFSDSFWFSAVEAEVYAMSSFFTAFVIWAMLKWEQATDQQSEQRWLLLIAYMVGLSIGVHILNLVCLPALTLLYYFKKQAEQEKSPTLQGSLVALLVGGVLIFFIVELIIPGLPDFAGKVEVFAVNQLGMPFNSGLLIVGIFLITGLVLALWYSYRRARYTLHLALMMFTLVLIGYASYGVVLIRAQYNPPINENDPSDAMRIVSYLKREQYGDRPLFYGPIFTAYPVSSEKIAPLYRKDEEKHKYVIYDHKERSIYDKNMLFPRVYSRDGSHARLYRDMLGIPEGKDPTFADNIAFFVRHQLGHMYFRYLMWNFAGRESDIQGAGFLAPWDTKKDLPELLANNKARNQFYSLPLLLGLLGLFFVYQYHRQMFFFTFLLFFFMGIALVIYLNSPPVEPRERDYIYVGSFYAFAMWIGFGVIAIAELLKKRIANAKLRMSLTAVLCLPIPLVMAKEGWDDHDRSDRYFQMEMAKNILNSCAPNAILFTAGDNDTFPLWYVQEVEGFRTDVRVCNLSLLGTDWYISQMRRQVYDSEPLPITLRKRNYILGVNEQIIVAPLQRLPAEQARQIFERGVNLQEFFDLLEKDHPVLRLANYGPAVAIFPSKKISISIDSAAVAAADWLPEEARQNIPDKMQWELPSDQFFKSGMMVLNMIATNAANGWQRPIYFAPTLGPNDYMGLQPYLQAEGFAYRLTPVRLGNQGDIYFNTRIAYHNLMNNTFWRNLDRSDIHYNEDYRRFVLIVRSIFARLAEQLLLEEKQEQARALLDYCLQVAPDAAVPYDVYTTQFIPVLIELGEKDKALNIARTMARRAKEEIDYAFVRRPDFMSRELMSNLFMLSQITQVLEQYEPDTARIYQEWLREYEGRAEFLRRFLP